ncbi:MAG: circularly permuted type 2 ATP-grasp protein [Erythrobacter sp.]|uniref:circularly permuted type 2 ATP-grasp protein n=1 Tax=Erythrobacter sp. TaxID=1042 RepID=UPI002621EA99|nr:circularly permuted type 2 ATP-grasp protein [Erythrobacter sp.]MDJ0979681.1 circularly permuted type 2 ATP-grasp protein [Erythrobacter sp.]
MIDQGPSPLPSSTDTDLFGPDPETDPLAYYRPQAPTADFYSQSAGDIRKAWHDLARGFARQCNGQIDVLQDYLDRHVEDLGLAFRIRGDEHERPWPLGPMPILIAADEWETVTTGLIQRADLLEKVIADLYTQQSLINDGHLPAAVVSGSADFARRMVGARGDGGPFLHTYAVDLARGPSGEWRVLADRVRFPIGIGYAIQNRQALARATGGLLASIGTRSHSGFFDALRRGIGASCQRDDPRVALLTPGRFNQSYPEQAILARQLGFSLVEGRDLTVREGRLFARTIAGLKRIDALWRWITTRDLDPMNFDARSQIGVPNLLAAARNGLVLTNWPGVGVVESRAMPAFLPKLSRVLMDEPLALPNAATWWCGGETERAFVLANLNDLVISSAFRRGVVGLEDGHTRPGASFSPEERDALERGLTLRPMDYTAQEVVELSTTPALTGGHFEARGFTLRAYLTREEDGKWVVLQGGFGRVLERGDLRTSLMGLGDISTDVCIIDAKRPAPPETVLTPRKHEIRREQGLLPSQAADNLFWLGRYGERAHQTARIVRVLVDQIALSGDAGVESTTATRLSKLLANLGASRALDGKISFIDVCADALGSARLTGSVLKLIEREQRIAQILRDRLSRDSWRAVQRAMPDFVAGDIESIALACDRLVERHATLSWLLSDGMSRGPEWQFLNLGMSIERASIILQAAQAVIPGSASADDLSALLDLIDCQSLYRSRYLSMPYIARVYDMALLEPAQPRGLAFQAAKIERRLAAIPTLRTDGMPERPLRAARQMRARIDGLEAAEIGPMTIQGLREDLANLSEAISERYFLQADDTDQTRTRRLF